jgi:hypothetical protein
MVRGKSETYMLFSVTFRWGLSSSARSRTELLKEIWIHHRALQERSLYSLPRLAILGGGSFPVIVRAPSLIRYIAFAVFPTYWGAGHSVITATNVLRSIYYAFRFFSDRINNQSSHTKASSGAPKLQQFIAPGGLVARRRPTHILGVT